MNKTLLIVYTFAFFLLFVRLFLGYRKIKQLGNLIYKKSRFSSNYIVTLFYLFLFFFSFQMWEIFPKYFGYMYTVFLFIFTFESLLKSIINNRLYEYGMISNRGMFYYKDVMNYDFINTKEKTEEIQIFARSASGIIKFKSFHNMRIDKKDKGHIKVLLQEKVTL